MAVPDITLFDFFCIIFLLAVIWFGVADFPEASEDDDFFDDRGEM